MVIKHTIRRRMSPVLLVGAVSISIVAGVSVLRYASAEEPQTAASQTVKTEVTSSVPEVTTHVQSDAATTPDQAPPHDEGDTGSQQSASQSQGSVTVNGQTYTVPGNGELHTTTSDGNGGQASIDISVQSSGSGQNYSSASSSVNVYSSSFNMSQSNGSTHP